MNDDFLLAPGPVFIPEDIRQAMALPLPHHRTPGFSKTFEEVRDGLQWLFQTTSPVLTLTCSGTGAFEAAMVNFSRRGDTVLVVQGGKFGERWGKVATAYGMKAVAVPVEWGEAVAPEALRELLLAHPECAMVTLSLSETSTGVLHPLEELVEVVRAHSQALLVVDGITAVGIHDIPMDALGVDVMVSGSQKAFGIPPGLAFVAAGERAWERAARSDHPRFYFDLERERKRQMQEGQTAFTPAISLVMGLHASLQKMQGEGLEAIFARHTLLSRAVRAGAQAIGLSLFPTVPSHGVTALLLPEGIHAPSVCRTMRDEEGVVIAGAHEPYKARMIRIGHMGFIGRNQILAGLGALEHALQVNGMDVEAGAALGAAQRVFLQA